MTMNNKKEFSGKFELPMSTAIHESREKYINKNICGISECSLSDRARCELQYDVDTNVLYEKLNEYVNCTCYIKQVIYKKPYTIVFWNDNTKTIAKTFDGDQYNCETGLLICVMKKLYSRDAIVDLMRDWVPNNQEEIADGEYIKVTLSDVRKKHR